MLCAIIVHGYRAALAEKRGFFFMGKIPIYATLHYDIRQALDISWNEYVFLDMVYKLSYDGWCYKSLETTASDLGLARRSIVNMRNRLLQKELLRKNGRGYLKVTTKYTEVAVQKVHRYKPKDHESVQKIPISVQKVHSTGAKSAPKNNNRITENKGIEKNGLGYLKAFEAYQRIKGIA